MNCRAKERMFYVGLFGVLAGLGVVLGWSVFVAVMVGFIVATMVS